MPIDQSTSWDASDLSHRYTVSFFNSQYGDEPKFVTRAKTRQNKDLKYFNIAGSDNQANATICAGLLVSYMEAQGIPYHRDKDRAGCFADLVPHLQQASGTVLYTADIIDHYFKFLGE